MRSPPFIGIITASFYVAQLISAPLWGRFDVMAASGTAGGLAALERVISFSVCLFDVDVGCSPASSRVRAEEPRWGDQALVADTVRPNRGLAPWVVIGGTNAEQCWGRWVRWQRLTVAAPGILAASLCVVNLVFAFMASGIATPGSGEAFEKEPVWRNAAGGCHPAGSAASDLIYAVGMFGRRMLSAVVALYLSGNLALRCSPSVRYFSTRMCSASSCAALLVPSSIASRTLVDDRYVVLMVGLAASLRQTLGFGLRYSHDSHRYGFTFSRDMALSKATDAAEYGTALGTAQTFAHFTFTGSVDGDRAVRISQSGISVFCRCRNRRPGMPPDFRYIELPPEARACGRYGRLLIEVIK
jgi:hypothetical protein